MGCGGSKQKKSKDERKLTYTKPDGKKVLCCYRCARAVNKRSVCYNGTHLCHPCLHEVRYEESITGRLYKPEPIASANGASVRYSAPPPPMQK